MSVSMDAVAQHYEYGIFFTWLAREKWNGETLWVRFIGWGKKYEHSLSCVYSYESEAFLKMAYRISGERWHRNEKKTSQTNEWTSGKKGPNKKVFSIHKRYRHCFVFHISSYLIFICHFVICVLLFCHSNIFFLHFFHSSSKDNRYVCLCLCVVCFMHVCCLFAVCQYRFVNYQNTKNAAHSNNSESFTEWKKEKKEIKVNLTWCENIQPRLSNSNINSSGWWWQTKQTHISLAWVLVPFGLYLLRFEVDLHEKIIIPDWNWSSIRFWQAALESVKSDARIFHIRINACFSFHSPNHFGRDSVLGCLCMRCPLIFFHLNSFLSV